MNRNEFKFLVVNTLSLWQEGESKPDADGLASLEIADGGLSLRQYYIHVLSSTFKLGEISPVDFALAACGLIFLLDSASKKLAILDTNSGIIEWVKCISFTAPRALAVDSANVYVADGDEAYCLARANYQIRWRVSILDSDLVDIAVNSRNGLYVLDAAGKQVFRVDAAGKLVNVIPTGTLEQPVAIAVDDEDHIFVLEGGLKQALRFSAGGELESTLLVRADAAFIPSALALDEEGNLYIGDGRVVGTPCRVDDTGKTTMLGYVGATRRLEATRGGDVYILGENEIALLKPVKRFIDKGTYISRAYDSTVPDCLWHKLVVDAALPSNTAMNVRYYISNAPAMPVDSDWSEEIVNFQDTLLTSTKGRYIRFKIELVSNDLHSESPTVNSLKVFFPRLSYLRYLPATYQEDETSREFLERFLSIFESVFSSFDETIITLTRYFDAGATPDAFLPWLSSWLALAYDENWDSTKVRQLIIKAPDLYRKRGTRTGIEEIIELYTGEKPIIVENSLLGCLSDKAVVSSLAAPASYGDCKLVLKTVSGFMAQDVVRVSEAAKQEFAIVEYIEGNTLNLRGKIGFDYNAGAAVRRASVLEVLYGDSPYRFCVLLKQSQLGTASEFNALRRIVEREKPAHTVGGVRALQPWLYLDMHTYLGINTALTEPAFVLERSSVISRDTVLADLEAAGQIDSRSRLAIDTKLT